MPTIEDQICDGIAEAMEAPRNSINEKSDHRTVEGWDSLRHFQLIAWLEREFDISFDDTEVELCVSVGAIVELVSRKLKRHGQP